MKILLFAAHVAGYFLLERLRDERVDGITIATYDERFIRRQAGGDFRSFQNHFPVTFLSTNRYAEAERYFSGSNYDCALCVEWTKDFFADHAPQFPVLYTHPAMLPLYRGYGAVTEQFIRGVSMGGMSVYQASTLVDAGDIVWQRRIPVGYDDYPLDFLSAYADTCFDFIMHLKQHGAESLPRTKQDPERGTYLVRKRRRDACIDFGMSAPSVHNFIRGYSHPYYGAFCFAGDRRLTVWRAQTEKWQGRYGEPGEVIAQHPYGVEIACGEGTVLLTEVEENGAVMRDADILLTIGEQLSA